MITFLLYQIQDSPNLEGQVPVFISPKNRMTRLYPQALGSLFYASYDSQGYGGGIRHRLHWYGLTDRENIFNLVSKEIFVDHSYPRKRVP
jgi:hypothetical protein